MNGSQIKAVSSGPKQLVRGTIIIDIRRVFIDKIDEIWTASQSTLRPW